MRAHCRSVLAHDSDFPNDVPHGQPSATASQDADLEQGDTFPRSTRVEMRTLWRKGSVE